MEGESGAKGMTYIFGLGLALEVGLDGFVLLVELRQIWDEIFDNVGVRQGVDPCFVGGVWRDAACPKPKSALVQLCD